MRKREILNKILSKLIEKTSERIERKKIFEKKRKKIYEKCELSEEEKKEIDSFFKENYGKKIPYNWHRLYKSYTGKFDKKYFPEHLYIPNFERKMNPYYYANVLEDKQIINFIAENARVKYPKMIACCINGTIVNEDYEIITIENLKKLLENRILFLKPRSESSSGKNCRRIHFINGIDIYTNKKIEILLKEYTNNFIIQNCLENHELLKKLHPNSINTFRVMTYIWKGKIYHCPIILRIGRGNKNVDNAHAGGIFVGINDNGELCEEAFTEYQDRYKEHPDTKIKFEGYKIPQITKVIETAKKLHTRILQIGIISWDLTLDNNEEVVLIEANIRGGSIWLIQMAHGCGLFGENTADILRFSSNKNIISREI